MKVAKSLLAAFIVGGALSVVGQLFLVMSMSILGPTSPFVGLMTLTCLGIFGAITFIFGFYQKLEKVGGFGAMLGFAGLATAVAGRIVAVKEDGGSSIEGVKAGLMLVVLIVGTGAFFSILVALIDRYLMML
ncbi:MAG: SpoVA/SpoVAEb family sporulation membrane protein [Raoultibacter sp.]